MFNTRQAFLALAAATVMASASASFAGSVTYTFNTSTPNLVIATTPPFPSPITDITGYAGIFNVGVTQTATDGLGVGRDHLINFGESSIFTLSPPVGVDSISFTAFTDNGHLFGVPFLPVVPGSGDNPVVGYIAADNSLHLLPALQYNPGSGFTYDFSGIPAGTEIKALSISAGDINDSFGIGTLTIDTGSAPSTTAVPLPSAAYSGLSLMAGLGLFAGVRKKRSLA